MFPLITVLAHVPHIESIDDSKYPPVFLLTVTLDAVILPLCKFPSVENAPLRNYTFAIKYNYFF